MLDPLTYLWPFVEAAMPIVSARSISHWPKEVREQLFAAGLLKAAGTAKRIRCPACDRIHTEEVVARESVGRQVRYFVPCPEVLRAEVQPSDLELFAVAIESLTSKLATLLSLSGKCTALASERVWRCGRWTDQGKLRDVLFARGLRRNDAVQIRGVITSAHSPVIFVGSDVPDLNFWQGRVPPVIRLSEVARLDAAQLQIDVVQVVGLIRRADDAGSESSVSLEQLKLLVRQQVKVANKSDLKDDIFVQAYRQYGSMRKAAEFLSTESGTLISKDQVQRAVARAGGAAEVLNAEDSDSVVRPVASQSRDKRGKTLIKSKTTKGQ